MGTVGTRSAKFEKDLVDPLLDGRRDWSWSPVEPVGDATQDTEVALSRKVGTPRVELLMFVLDR
jgi:hypothetical protein